VEDIFEILSKVGATVGNKIFTLVDDLVKDTPLSCVVVMSILDAY
jgi:hypothetical protein